MNLIFSVDLWCKMEINQEQRKHRAFAIRENPQYFEREKKVADFLVHTCFWTRLFAAMMPVQMCTAG